MCGMLQLGHGGPIASLSIALCEIWDVKEIEFTSAAVRQWRKLTTSTRGHIDLKLKAFAESGVGDVKALKGAAGMRLRSGDWRVLFTIRANTITKTPPRYLRLRGHYGKSQLRKKQCPVYPYPWWRRPRGTAAQRV